MRDHKCAAIALFKRQAVKVNSLVHDAEFASACAVRVLIFAISVSDHDRKYQMDRRARRP